ncbi:cysteine protease [Verticillium nonalfalfae]|uniref:Cysteine protease n=1 Tax=Verticillium nonalfalfae TaxID=1051616 RepID=A0A3M9Y6X8_9PEZI|nr:cysteine protease [Verticillium nonalfalfae]RNJ55248.1 cysteine protease [Verticillium nonalfalfae]
MYTGYQVMNNAEHLATSEEQLSRQANRDTKQALQHAIASADFYMKAYAEATNATDRLRLRRKCREMITWAEQLKSKEPGGISSPPTYRKITGEEEAILRKSSYLHACFFPPWQSDPSDDVFELPAGYPPYTDHTEYAMSHQQNDILGGWERPDTLVGSLLHTDEPFNGTTALMAASGDSDLVQDITTDCSVVASLCAAMDVLVTKSRGKPLLSRLMFPYDHTNDCPKLSQSGKYIFRMHFNGCFREVVIDDRLPVSRAGIDRNLFVVDRRNPDLLWPALMEKAYLKVRGGYDFPGSNSGTDLWVLTGWIPEQLFLQSEDVDLNQTWSRMLQCQQERDLIITLGTGRLTHTEEDALGLVGEHDYAVLRLEEVNGARRLLVKNPWCDGLVWKGAALKEHSRSTANPPSVGSAGGAHLEMTSTAPSRGTFWISLEEVAQNFESMYLNWNPSCFGRRQDHHFTWHVPAMSWSGTFAHNPQYSICSSTGDTVWILLSRHFADAELSIARNQRSGSLASVARRLGYTSISIFDNGGKRVQEIGGALYRGPFVDSPQTLAKFALDAGKTYTVVMAHEELPLNEYSCTFSFFSATNLKIGPAEEVMRHYRELSSSWTRRSAGGNASSPTYSANPQFSITVSRSTPLSILLTTGSRDIAVHTDLVWSSGKRVSSIGRKDVVASSGDYRCGSAHSHVANLEAGTYVIVCSTFEPGQLSDFAIRIGTMIECAVRPVPGDGAGLLCTRLPTLEFAAGEERKRASITAPRLTRAYASARCPVLSDENGQHISHAAIRIVVMYGRGPNASIHAISCEGEFRDPTTAVRTPEFDVEPDRVRHEGLWIVIEQLGSHRAWSGIEVEILGDNLIRSRPWEDLD